MAIVRGQTVRNIEAEFARAFPDALPTIEEALGPTDPDCKLWQPCPSPCDEPMITASSHTERTE